MTGGGREQAGDEASLPSHYVCHIYSKPPPPVVYFNVFTSFKTGKNKTVYFSEFGIAGMIKASLNSYPVTSCSMQTIGLTSIEANGIKCQDNDSGTDVPHALYPGGST